jgi:signal transduction histidine kinase
MADLAGNSTRDHRDPDTSAARGRLLIVDDSRYDLKFLSKGMRARGHEIVTAATGEEGLLRLSEADFDLVLLDGRLPTLDGLEVLKLIRQLKSRLQLPVIMTTGWDHPESMVEALRSGANDYVTKPLDLNIVAARVETQLVLLRLLHQREEFLAFATHDLRTPLSVIMGYTSVLKMKHDAGSLVEADVASSIDGLHKTAAHMAGIVTDFVDFHALQAGGITLSLEEVDIGELVGYSADLIRELADDKSITLKIEVIPTGATVECDKRRIVQVLQNLAGNAIKFCKPGCQVLIRAVANEDHVRIEVRDDGPGIRPDQKKLLFTKFAQLSAEPTAGETSSGLGLSLSKQLVQLHGGTIGAEDNPEGGATFWFTLPKPGWAPA